MRLKDDVFVGLDGETSGAGIDIFSPVLRDESFERRKMCIRDRLYIPQLSRITAPIRDRHIYEDHKHGGLDVPKLALKYALTDAYTRQIIKERERIEKRAVRPVSK